MLQQLTSQTARFTALAVLLTSFAWSNSAASPGSDVYDDAGVWWRTVPRKLRERPEFDFVVPVEGQPNVLLIGDSVSMSYTADVRAGLLGTANVYRVPANARSTVYTLPRLEEFIGHQRWDLIVINWGLHDLTYFNDERKATPPPDGRQAAPADQYRENLMTLVTRLKDTGAQLLWVSTTPIQPKGERRGTRFNADVERYNMIAADVMRETEVPMLDLYAYVTALHETIQDDGLHFTDAGAKQLARLITAEIGVMLVIE